MKVRLERSGGVAGIRLSAELDSDALPQEGSRRLARLVEISGVLGLPARGSVPPSGPDRFTYRLTVQTEGTEHIVEVAEDAVTPALEPLIDWLLSRARGRTV